MRSKIISFLLFILLYIGFLGMVLTVYQYHNFDTNIGFLVQKQAYLDNPFWKFAFYLHVFTCFLCLAAGFTQFSSFIQTKYLKLHRFLGRIYVYNIVFINFPVGLVLAFYANGGIFSKAAFVILAVLWVYYTIAAVYWIKQGDIVKHKKYVIRSYALTLSALTLRMSLIVLSCFTKWSYENIYIIDAWVALVLNLLIAEIIIYKINLSAKSKSY